MFEILDILVLVVMLFLGFYVTIIIHELGHIIFGKLSGYEFVSYRVGSLMILKKDGKFIWKKFTLPGTGGQGLMRPVQKDPYHYPHVLYNFGGVIANFVFLAITILLYARFKHVNYLSLFLMSASIFGLFNGIVNGIPLRFKGMPNDGFNVASMMKDDESRRAAWIQFQYHALMTKGIRIKEMPKEWLVLPKEADLVNPLISTIGLYRCRYLRDINDFNNAKLLCEEILHNAPTMIPAYQNELMCDLIFYEMIGDCNTGKINRLYTEQLKKYIKDTCENISSIRFMYSYELIVNSNQAKAEKYLKQLKKTERTYPFEGEIESERELIRLVQSLA
ncbi:MAG: site-2 protease family protein [Lachnospiraceae bacterium]